MANEIIRPTQLPARADPVASEVVPSDNGSAVAGVTWADGVNAAVPPASQSESEAGLINTKRMTPLTTKQAIDAQVPPKISAAIGALNLGTASQAQVEDFATAVQGAKADSAVQPSRTVGTGTGLTGGGNLSADRTISLSSGTIASLGRADSSVQTVNGNAPDGSGNVSINAEFLQEQNSVTTAMAESFASTVEWVRTAGYSSANDGGGSMYRRVLSEPSHAGKFQSADGAWWEAVGISPNIDTPALYPTHLYSVIDNLGVASHSFMSRHTEPLPPGKDRYTVFIGNYDAGTGNPEVLGSSWGLGVTTIKDNWADTEVKGQCLGISVVTRSGYNGPNDGDPYLFSAGDTAAYIANVAQADSDNFAAVLEGVSYYMPGGVYNHTNQKNIRVQIGAIKDSIGIAIGYLAVANNGALGAAFQAQNSFNGGGNPEEGPTGVWSHFLRYVTDFGAGGYDAFMVNQLGNIVMNNGPEAPVPNQKVTLRAGFGGGLEVVNSSGAGVMLSVNDSGLLSVGYAIDLPKSSVPLSPSQGRIWFDVSVGKIKICEDGVNWKTVTTS